MLRTSIATTAVNAGAGRHLARALLLVGTTLLIVALIRTAWLCDDAFITLRTADNILAGHGPVWNVGERVQAFTHPLWLALLIPVYAAIRAPYAAALLGALLTLGAVAIVMLRVGRSGGQRLVFFAALLSSKGFIDYSTSGLENALANALLAIFLWQWWETPRDERRTRRLACLAGLCVLTRPDLLALVGPAVAVDAYQLGPRMAVRPLIVGLLPLVAWELFSFVYYGSFVPNTAYAKLNTGIPLEVLLRFGAQYYKRTLFGDPVTLFVVILTPLTIPASRWRRDWPIVLGIVLFCLYVLVEGGDFMMSRFFTAPFFVGAVLLARAWWIPGTRQGAAAAAVCIVVGLCAGGEPALLGGYGYSRIYTFVHGVSERDSYGDVVIDRIADERRYYASFAFLRTYGTINHEWAERGRELRREQRRVFVTETIGLTGYFAGPDVHIIDPLALADPFLARLPASDSSRIGHFRRELPEGYVDTVASGVNHIRDSRLARYYDQLHVIVSGPLWSWRRIKAIVTLAPRP